MTTRYFGQPIRRNEDPRLLTGQAPFTDDVHLPGHAARGVRAQRLCPRPHRGIDTSRRATCPAWWPSTPPPTWATTGSPARCWSRRRPSRTWSSTRARRCRWPRTRCAMRASRLRWSSPKAATSPRTPSTRSSSRWRCCRPWSTSGRGAAARRAARPRRPGHRTSTPTSSRRRATTPRRRSAGRRGHQAPLRLRPRHGGRHGEPRHRRRLGRARAEQLTIWDTTQAPIPIRNGLAGMLGLSENQVRVIAPFIGGGFGPKIMMFYPEEVLIPWIAMRLGRPVKWIEDRRENFFATTQERGQVHEAEIALTQRRQDPGRQGRLPARHRRLCTLRPDRAAQQPVHAAGPVRRAPTTTASSRRSSPTSRSSRPTAAPAASTASS